MHAHPVLVLPLMLGGGVFFYLITRPNASNASVWKTWSCVVVSVATLHVVGPQEVGRTPAERLLPSLDIPSVK